MTVIARCWVITHPEFGRERPVVMWDTASADWYREQGWTVEEFVPSANATGAVSRDDAHAAIVAELTAAEGYARVHADDVAARILTRIGGQ